MLRIRLLITVAFGVVVVALVVLLLGYVFFHLSQSAARIAAILGVVAGLIALAMSSLQGSLELLEKDRKIKKAEQRVEKNPGETQAAWELARVELERYIDRNLSQVRSIFWLTTLVMIVGFTLIAYGVINAYGAPERFKASLLAATAGVVVNFIGASFLVIYRSTMSQAKEYVTILERINAVGMAVQILEKIEDRDGLLRSQTTSDLAKQLLVLYTSIRQADAQG